MSDNNTSSNNQSKGDNENMAAKRRNPLLTALIVVAVLGLAVFLVKRISDSIIPDVPGVTLTDIHRIEDLRARFNQDQGAPRLVLLVSPT